MILPGPLATLMSKKQLHRTRPEGRNSYVTVGPETPQLLSLAIISCDANDTVAMATMHILATDRVQPWLSSEHLKTQQGGTSNAGALTISSAQRCELRQQDNLTEAASLEAADLG